MRLIRQNLLRSAALRREQRRWRRMIGGVYLFILLITGITIAYVYQTNLFIAKLYQREIQKIQSSLDQLKPKIVQIEKLYRERDNFINQVIEYQQRRHRAEFWLNKLQPISELLPLNMRIDEIHLNPAARPGQEIVLIKGTFPLPGAQNDLTTLYVYKKALEEDPHFMFGLARIEFLQNRIFVKDGVQTVSYTIGVFEK